MTFTMIIKTMTLPFSNRGGMGMSPYIACKPCVAFLRFKGRGGKREANVERETCERGKAPLPVALGHRAPQCVCVTTGRPSSKYEHRRASALLRNIRNIRICREIVSVTYENERITTKNSLPYVKCVLRLSCVVHWANLWPF